MQDNIKSDQTKISFPGLFCSSSFLNTPYTVSLIVSTLQIKKTNATTATSFSYLCSPDFNASYFEKHVPYSVIKKEILIFKLHFNGSAHLLAPF